MPINKEMLLRALKAKWSDEALSDYELDARIDALDEVTFPLFNEYMHTSWHHRSTFLVMNGKDKCPSIDELGNSIDRYLECDFLRTPQLDWLLADAIVFSETNATTQQIGPARWTNSDGSPNIWMLLFRLAFALICWSIWLALALGAYLVHPLILAALVVITIVSQISKRKSRRKVAETLASMADVYGSLDNLMPSWRNVYSLMEASRAKGAKWPTPLFRLVERNITGLEKK